LCISNTNTNTEGERTPVKAAKRMLNEKKKIMLNEKKLKHPKFLGIYTYCNAYVFCDKSIIDPNTRDFLKIGIIYFNYLEMKIFRTEKKYSKVHSIIESFYKDLLNKDAVRVSVTGQMAQIVKR
jgi:hypothetical protein